MKKINRRQIIQGLSFAGGIILAKGCSSFKGETNEASAQDAFTERNGGTNSNMCVLFPEQTEGPYYLDLNLLRKDITEGSPGVPLQLALKVVDIPGCTPVSNAAVDIWHCDASGVYAGFGATATPPGPPPARRDRNSNNLGEARAPGAGGGMRQAPNNSETFLRGTQVTDTNGQVEFLTIYPGWYAGRTTHIHLKVHLDPNTALTSQMYFPDDITDAVYAHTPYDRRPNRTTTNNSDRIMSDSAMATATQLNISANRDGYTGSLTIGVNRA